MNCVSPVGKVYQAGTLSGNPVAMAAGIAMLNAIRNERPYERLDALGKRLEIGLLQAAQAAGQAISVNRVGSMMTAFFGALAPLQISRRRQNPTPPSLASGSTPCWIAAFICPAASMKLCLFPQCILTPILTRQSKPPQKPSRCCSWSPNGPPLGGVGLLRLWVMLGSYGPPPAAPTPPAGAGGGCFFCNSGVVEWKQGDSCGTSQFGGGKIGGREWLNSERRVRFSVQRRVPCGKSLIGKSETACNMNSATFLEKPKDIGVLKYAKSGHSEPLRDIVDAYSCELPKTAWLSKLHLDEPRQNLKCLPVSFRAVKRLFDIVGSVTLLILCSPIMLTAAILVKLTSPGP